MQKDGSVGWRVHPDLYQFPQGRIGELPSAAAGRWGDSGPGLPSATGCMEILDLDSLLLGRSWDTPSVVPQSQAPSQTPSLFL